MNPTNLRLKLLKLIYTRDGYYISGIASEICPRKSSKGWTRQAGTRWGHAFIAPMIKAELIEKYYDSKMVKITASGIEYLNNHST